MKDIAKNIIIIALMLAIAAGGYWIRNYTENVNDSLNSGIYSSLTITQKQLVSLRAELNQYKDNQMSPEDFSNIMHEYSFDFFFYNDYTGDYKHIDKAYDYLDFFDLNSYILDLCFTEMTADELEYHKANLAKICMYFNSLNFEKNTDYAHPNPKLKLTFEKIHRLIKQGESRIDNEEQLKKLEASVTDIYTDHYHFNEVHNGNVYLIRRIGSDTDEDGNWTDELWKYGKNSAGQKLYAFQGLDFRVSPNEKYISVTDDNVIHIINEESVSVKDYTIPELSNGEYMINNATCMTMQWSDDSRSFWAGINELSMPLMLIKIDAVNWDKTEAYDISELPNSDEFILNPNTGKIVLSDYPHMFTVEDANEFEASKEKVTLYYYYLAEKKLTPIESSSAKMFNPQWVDDFTIEFDNPKGQDRLKYRLKD